MKFATILLACTMMLATDVLAASTLTLAKMIALPGVKGRFDHFAIDVKGRRLSSLPWTTTRWKSWTLRWANVSTA